MAAAAQKRPDPDPLAEVLAGDPSAIRLFYREYGPLLLEVIRRVLRRCGRADESEDCLQVVFLELFSDNARALRKWRPELGRGLRTYLCVLANYRSRAWLRRRQPLTLTDAELQRLAEASPELGLEQEGHLILDEFVTRLKAECSPEEWRLFVLCFLEDRSPEEIALQLGMNVPAVYQRKRRLRLRLEALLAAQQR